MKNTLSAAKAVLLCMFFVMCAVLSGQEPVVNRGRVDLSKWNFDTKSFVELNGQWGFFWNEFVQSGESPADFINVPDVWNAQSLKGKKYPAYGYATYTAKVLLPAGASGLGLYIEQPMTSVRVFVNNQEIGSIGKTEKSKNTYKPAAERRVFPFPTAIPNWIL
ncbi:hypothetical protein V1L52_05000 [Treponema sp. HNW]|uniref:hypothetical protein n=1 Tax=Treponema sp. HNW TaxID=3116654 RepID=UPI003D13E03C